MNFVNDLMTATLFLTIDRERHCMKKKPPLKKRQTVEIVRSDYQPSKAELEEDMSVDTSFEELMHGVIEPVIIKYIPRPKHK